MIKPVALITDQPGRVDLTGKAAIITRVGTRVGREIAGKLAASGAAVMLVDGDSVATDRVASALRAFGRGVETMQLGTTDENEVEQLVRTTKDRFSRIDLLVLQVQNGAETTRPALRGRSLEAARGEDMAPLSRAVARELASAKQPGKIIVIRRKARFPGNGTPPQSDASKAAVDVFLAHRAEVRVTFGLDDLGNLIEITSNWYPENGDRVPDRR